MAVGAWQKWRPLLGSLSRLQDLGVGRVIQAEAPACKGPEVLTNLLACLEKKLKVKTREKQVSDGTNGL